MCALNCLQLEACLQVHGCPFVAEEQFTEALDVVCARLGVHSKPEITRDWSAAGFASALQARSHSRPCALLALLARPWARVALLARPCVLLARLLCLCAMRRRSCPW